MAMGVKGSTGTCHTPLWTGQLLGDPLHVGSKGEVQVSKGGCTQQGAAAAAAWAGWVCGSICARHQWSMLDHIVVVLEECAPRTEGSQPWTFG
jgi:hypothetical protein